jgi:hypothetical protein
LILEIWKRKKVEDKLLGSSKLWTYCEGKNNMLKCLTISTVNEPFGSSNGEADLTFAGTEASLSTNGEMGVDRRFSEFIGNDLMASATSYLKGYMLTSLSDIR